MPDSFPIPAVLTAYGLPHLLGYLPTRDGVRHPSPISPTGLMDAAVDFGLAGVEFDLFWATKSASPESLRDALESRNLHIVLDFKPLVDAEVETVREYLKTSARVGATVVRAMISGIVCGRRFTLPGGWEARLAATAQRLRDLLPLAEDLGLCIALENHQDATTDDLIRLGEMSGNSPAYGVTLDTGNPLSVGEGPVEAARRLGPLLRHLHMKDYTIHFAPEGYRLVRCAAGDGVVDFPAILEVIRGHGRDVIPGIEVGAQATRTIPILEDEWWTGFPPGHRDHLLPALRILWAQGRPMDEPYSSAWERGEGTESVSAEEWEVVRRSVDYFHRIMTEK